ncbi:MAG: transaldolase family protein [Candidatus Promineifilaceae bacterium]
MSKLLQLHDFGQSTWLNYMRRAFIQSGELRQCIADGIQGITANAAVFQDTIAHHTDYDQAIHQEIVNGTPYNSIHNALMVDDVQRAADILHPVFESSQGLDGFASLELNPSLAHQAVETAATAGHILARIDRGNAMVEIPATQAGCEAIRSLTSDGVCINATHIFSISGFERAAQAYICGLEIYFETHSIWRIAPTAVASFSVSPIDTAVDPLLAAKGLADWQGQTGIALARMLYARFEQIFRGPRWQRLAGRGARPLRPKWTRIQPTNPTSPPMFYIDALLGPNTVMTFTPETLDTFQKQGFVAETLARGRTKAQNHLDRLAEAGIDLDQMLDELQAEHLAASQAQYQHLVKSVNEKLFVVGR